MKINLKRICIVILFCCPLFSFGQHSDLIPADKGLDPQFVKSLYERGAPTVYLKSRNELRYIGMPVGGIMAGGVYLGGDGRLWLWDIFNRNQEGIEPKIVPWKKEDERRNFIRSRDGACYIEPASGVRPLQQGFIIKFEYDGKIVYKTLEENGWDEIAFQATYPIGTIRYTDKNLPIELTLQAYSPFIPLNEEDSGLPATILSFSMKNNSKSTVKMTVLGYLENKSGIYSAHPSFCRRLNQTIRKEGFTAVFESLQILKKEGDPIKTKFDFGNMCIAALDPKAGAYNDINPSDVALISGQAGESFSKPLQEALIGAVQTVQTVAPNQVGTADFIISWYFPNFSIDPKIKESGRYYQNKFASALEVTSYIQTNYQRLSSETKLWHATWQESTLPNWFLERTFVTINTLATTNCHRFSSGRFWAWEGVGACHGTCTHVWHYAQAMGRIFPALERDCRERTDLNIAMQPDGGIMLRAEMETRPAIDGQAGTILRCYREHQMSVDDAFLKRNWTQIKKAVQFILDQDRNGDGMEDTPMENTLDAVWDGEIAWIVGLCISSVKAAQEMASEVGDKDFAKICGEYVEKGSKNMDKYLFNGEYYIHRPDKEKGKTNLGSYNTCHIDQVLGQAWAHQVGLGAIQDPKKSASALESLWKYNYTKDVGPYIAVNTGGRPYALAGEGGMIMNTNPKNEPKPYGNNITWQMGYFHECMSGFEYQVAAHMIAQGMTDQGLVMIRSIHDRYHAAKRNPFNEIECSDHYARAMASYGAFITACGYEYHGPKGYMRFAPQWDQSNFKAAFTAAQGWGTYTQNQTDKNMNCTLQAHYGKVELKTFGVQAPSGKNYKSVKVVIDNKSVKADLRKNGRDIQIVLHQRIIVGKGQMLKIDLM